MTKIIDIEFIQKKYIDDGFSCGEIADLVGNVTRQGIFKALRKAGVPIRSKKDAIFYENGQRCKISQGYFWIWQPEHPRANGGYVKRATLNLEAVIGRRLVGDEMAHHGDENRMNDNPENLQLTTRIEHKKLHRRTA